MGSALCHLFAIPLGAALLTLIIWPFLRSWLDRKLLRFGNFGIIWLNQESRNRLGRCARPVKLRGMEPATIEQFFNRKPFDISETRPTSLQITTWPLQARLICDGKFDELRERQAEWIADPRYEAGGDEVVDFDREETVASFPSKADFIWLALLAALIATSIGTYLISKRLGCPITEIVEVEVPVPYPYPVIGYPNNSDPRKFELLSDQLFVYGEARLPNAQKARALSSIQHYFSNFDDVIISRIEGFTDPIGTLCSNEKLATERARSIETLLKEYQDTHPNSIKLADDLKVGGSGPSSSQEDVEMWSTCAAAPELSQRIGGRTPFQASGACASANQALTKIYRDPITPTDLTDLRRVPEVAAMSRAQHQLMSCVSPMRRVTISFSGTLQGKNDQQNRTVEKEPQNATGK
jgi:outer membrane protein OmpA-like peptidoglycan-associated protein